MLTLLTLIAKRNRQWFNLDFTSIRVANLLNDYGSIYVSFLVPSTGLVKQANLRNFVGIQEIPNTTLLIDFITNYDGALGGSYVSSEWRNIDKKKYVVYKNVWDFGLDVELVNLQGGILTPSESYVPDIKLTATSEQLSAITEIEQSSLFTVNGVVLPSMVVNDSIILKDATRVLERVKEKNISIINFSNVGTFTKRALSIFNPTLFNTITELGIIKAYVFKIDMPLGGDVRDVLLVINGLLMIFKNYTIIDDNYITIKIPVELMLTQLVGIRASEVDWIQAATTNDDGFDVATIDPIKYIKNNSYVIVMSIRELCVETQFLHRTGFIDTYTLPTNPVGLMYHRDGSMGEYKVTWSNESGSEITCSHCKINRDLRSQAYCTAGTNNSDLSFISDTTDAVLKTLYIL